MFGGIIKISMQSSSQKINKMIQKRYDQNQLLLDLNVCNYWCQILFSRDWSFISRLNLSNCRINSHNLQLILRLNWPNLNYLNLSYNQLNDQDISQFCKRDWPKLESLDLSGNKNLRDQGLITIFYNRAKQLKELTLQSSGITSSGIKQIINFQSVNIRVLTLSNNRIGNTGIKWLIKLNLFHLNKLSIQYCKIETQGFTNLTKANWPNLTHLYLDSIGQTDQSNRMRLNGWSLINNNQWKNIKIIAIVTQQQPINYMNLSVMQCININEYHLQFQNQPLLIDIMEIIRRRNLSNNL